MRTGIFQKVFAHPDNKRMCRERVSSSTNWLDQRWLIAAYCCPTLANNKKCPLIFQQKFFTTQIISCSDTLQIRGSPYPANSQPFSNAAIPNLMVSTNCQQWSKIYTTWEGGRAQNNSAFVKENIRFGRYGVVV